MDEQLRILKAKFLTSGDQEDEYFYRLASLRAGVQPETELRRGDIVEIREHTWIKTSPWIGMVDKIYALPHAWVNIGDLSIIPLQEAEQTDHALYDWGLQVVLPFITALVVKPSKAKLKMPVAPDFDLPLDYWMHPDSRPITTACLNCKFLVSKIKIYQTNLYICPVCNRFI